MEPASSIDFGEYRLEPNVPRLTRGNHPVALQPRPLAVLCYLAARPGVVVSRDELIRTLWAGTHVTRAVEDANHVYATFDRHVENEVILE